MREWILKIAIIVGSVALAAGALYHFIKEERNEGFLTLYGNVDVRLVDMGFRIPGRIDKLFFEEGDVVQEGDLLCTLDKTPYDSEYRQAGANVEAAKAELNLAQIQLTRRLELIGIGGVSQEDVDNAQANYEQLLANLQQAEAALQVQADNIAYTEVFAPTKGVILTRILEPGSVVNPANPVYSISVASPVWIRAYVDEEDLGSIYFGMPAEIYTDTHGAHVYHGKIGFISPMAEFTPKTVETTRLRTDLVYRLRIYADNPDWRLKQGMPVTIKLKLRHD